MKKINKIWVAIWILLSVSCSKFIEIDAPHTEIEQSAVFEDDATATSAVAGLYYRLAQANNVLFNGGITTYLGLSADEIYNTSANANYDPFVSNTLDVTNSVVGSTFWLGPYKNIYQTNAIIEGIKSATKLSPAVSNQLLGEALTIRALHYFYLVNLFGDVPLVTSSDFNENELKARTSSDKVKDQIVADLVEAKGLLSNEYPSSGKLRVNKLAASALLARVYLFNGKWEEAITEASEVISSGSYSLVDMNSIFLSNSQEAILQFSMPLTASTVTSEGSVFIPTSATKIPACVLTDVLKNSFETGDGRRASWTKTNVINATSYTYPYKYKTRTVTAGSTKPEQITVLRLAEMYLIRAEAAAHVGNLSAGIKDLDVVRARAGLSGIEDMHPGMTQTDLLEAIYHEDQIEFFAEWGHRWLDLKRTGKIDQVLSENKSSWKPYAKLFPIPYGEILKNPNLIQNEGYN